MSDKETLETTAEQRSTEASGTEASQAVSELEECRLKVADLEDRLLRKAAEFENFRRRALKERALSVEIGKQQVALPVLDVFDDLRRSVEAVDQADTSIEGAFNSLREGVRLVFEKLQTELDKLGIRPIDAVGEDFDESLHEAVMQQSADEGTEPGTVLAEVQKGYMIGDRVLRHARVVVAS